MPASACRLTDSSMRTTSSCAPSALAWLVGVVVGAGRDARRVRTALPGRCGPRRGIRPRPPDHRAAAGPGATAQGASLGVVLNAARRAEPRALRHRHAGATFPNIDAGLGRRRRRVAGWPRRARRRCRVDGRSGAQEPAPERARLRPALAARTTTGPRPREAEARRDVARHGGRRSDLDDRLERRPVREPATGAVRLAAATGAAR